MDCQEIKPLFNSMKTLIIVLELAMYSLELEMKFKQKIKFISEHLPYFFFHASGNAAFFLFGLNKDNQKSYICMLHCNCILCRHLFNRGSRILWGENL
jgi:hypothetical protein